MKYYIGIDIAKDKFDCLWLKDVEQLKIKTKVFPNSKDGFKTLKKWFEKNITKELDSIYVCL